MCLVGTHFGINRFFAYKYPGSFIVVSQVHIKFGPCQCVSFGINIQLAVKQRFHNVSELFEVNHINNTIVYLVCFEELKFIIFKNIFRKNIIRITHYIQIDIIERPSHQFENQRIEFIVISAFAGFIQ